MFLLCCYVVLFTLVTKNITVRLFFFFFPFLRLRDCRYFPDPSEVTRLNDPTCFKRLPGKVTCYVACSHVDMA